MMRSGPLRRGLAMATALLPQLLFAHAGHDHADVPPPPVTVEPRFSTHAGAVEVTGVRGKGVLWLYVNRYASNAPWDGLAVDVEIDGNSLKAEPLGGGLYRAGNALLSGSAAHDVIVTLQGDDLEELLVAELPAAKAQQSK